jgi:parallel beta-helix repeat protein
MAQTIKNQQKREDPKPEPIKALPPYQPWHKNWLVLSVGIALIIVAIIIYLQIPKSILVSPTPIPTSPVQIVTATPYPTSILEPTATEVPLATIAPREAVKCGDLTKSVKLSEDLFSAGSCFVVKKEGVIIDCDGFKLTGEMNKSSIGIYTNYSNTLIKNCEITRFELGISLKKSDSTMVQDSSFIDNLGSIFVENSDNVVVKNNKFLKTTEGAIRVWGAEGMVIEDNFIDNNQNYGIYFSGSNNNFVRRNSIYRSNIGLQLAGSNGNVLSDNNLTSNGGAIKLTQESTNNTVENNVVQSSKGVGIHFIFASGNILRKNTVTKNEYGINVYDSLSTLENNFVCDNSIEDVECRFAQNAIGNICYTRATTCGFQCVMKCPSAK